MKRNGDSDCFQKTGKVNFVFDFSELDGNTSCVVQLRQQILLLLLVHFRLYAVVILISFIEIYAIPILLLSRLPLLENYGCVCLKDDNNNWLNL